MGLFDKLLNKKETVVEMAVEPGILYLPIEGEVISLEEIGDGVFSSGVTDDFSSVTVLNSGSIKRLSPTLKVEK